MSSAAERLNETARAWWSVLLESGWQATLVAALAIAVALVLRRRWPAPLRYGLLALALLKFVLPPIAILPIGLLPRLPFENERRLPAAATRAADELAQPEPRPGTAAPTSGPDLSPSTTAGGTPDVAAAPAIGPSPVSMYRSLTWKAWLMLAHAVGTLGILVWTLVQLFRLRGMHARAREAPAGDLRERFETLRRCLGIRRRVRLLTSDEAGVPMSSGFLRPVVTLPRYAAHDLDANTERDATLAHELAHVLRLDGLLVGIEALVLALWWFNPVAWWLVRALRHVREQCCDDLVLAKGLATPQHLGQAIVRAAAQLGAWRSASAVSSMCGPARDLEARVRRLLDVRVPRRASLSLAQCAGLLIAGCAVLPSARNQSSDGGVDTGVRTDIHAQAEIRGRFVLPSGAPAAGVKLEFSAWPGGEDEVIAWGRAVHWTDIESSSASDGSFSIRYEPPPPYQVLLESSLAGHPSLAWRWSSARPQAGDVIDLGEIRLVPAAAIEGRLLSPEGKPVGGNWRVRADFWEPLRSTRDGSVRAAIAYAVVSPDSGEYQLDDLLPGPWRVQAGDGHGEFTGEQLVEVPAGACDRVDFVHILPRADSPITVKALVRPDRFHTVDPDAAQVKLLQEGNEPRTGAKDGFGNILFRDVSPGPYTLVVDDPRFAPWRAELQAPQTPDPSASILGGSAIQLKVADGNDARAIEEYQLAVRFDESDTSGRTPNAFSLRLLGEPVPPGGIYKELLSTSCTLIVSSPSYAPREIRVAELRREETRHVAARLGKWSVLSGRVLESDGETPAPGVFVGYGDAESVRRFASSPYVVPDVDDSMLHMASDGLRESQHTRTDIDGRFRFERVAPASYELVALPGNGEPIFSDVIVQNGEVRSDLLLAAGSTWLTGRLDIPQGAAVADIFISLNQCGPLPSASGSTLPNWSRMREIRSPLQPDGSFRVGPLAGSRFFVLATLPSVKLPTGSDGWIGYSPSFMLETIDLSVAGTTTRTYDLRDCFPSNLRVQVRLDGRIPPPVVVEALGPNRASYGGARSDERGIASFRCWSGEVTLEVRTLDTSMRASQGPMHVSANGSVDVEIDIKLIAGVIQLVDEETGQPLANMELDMRQGDPRASFGSLGRGFHKTDAEGRLALVLPHGLVRFQSRGALQRELEALFASAGKTLTDAERQEKPLPEVRWTPDGPQPPVLKIPKRVQ